MIEITMYPAKEGDAFLLSFGEDKHTNIIIDMGLSVTYKDFIRQDLIKLSKSNRKIDLLVVTHVDEDHIQGAISFFEENGREQNVISVNEVWHNSYRHLQFSKEKTQITSQEYANLELIQRQSQSSPKDGESNISVKQGSTLASHLYANRCKWNGSFNNQAVSIDNQSEINISDVKILILSPNRDKLNTLAKCWLRHLNSIIYEFNLSEDEIFDDAYEFFVKYLDDEKSSESNVSLPDDKFDIEQLVSEIGKDRSKTNGSSISFIIEFQTKKLLFLADAHNDIILKELTRLKENGYGMDFDLVKVSHHGSKNNTSKELLHLIQAKHYLISTNGDKHDHPDLESIAKIATANHTKEIITNYKNEKLKVFENDELKKKYGYEIRHCNKLKIV